MGVFWGGGLASTLLTLNFIMSIKQEIQLGQTPGSQMVRLNITPSTSTHSNNHVGAGDSIRSHNEVGNRIASTSNTISSSSSSSPSSSSASSPASSSIINFLQLNCHKRGLVAREIANYTSEFRDKPFVCMLTEPYVNFRGKNGEYRVAREEDRIYKVGIVPTGNLFFCNSEGAPRAALYADKSQDLAMDSRFSGRDIVTCRWNTTLADPSLRFKRSSDKVTNDFINTRNRNTKTRFRKNKRIRNTKTRIRSQNKTRTKAGQGKARNRRNQVDAEISGRRDTDPPPPESSTPATNQRFDIYMQHVLGHHERHS